MAQLNEAFNPLEYDPSAIAQGKLPVSGPDGYTVFIVDSQIVENKERTGAMLVLTLQVSDGEYKGEQGLYRLNLYSQSVEACQIAKRQFSAICHVCGQLGVITDTKVLHNIPFKAVVGLQKNEKEGGYTEVKGVKDINGENPKKGSVSSNSNSWGEDPNENIIALKSEDGFTYEEMLNAGWTDDDMLADERYSILVPKKTPKKLPVNKDPETVVENDDLSEEIPPWEM